MVSIIVATMVKDEEDIIKQWIEYYGKIFGYKNLYIIDNYSTDNTYNFLQEYIPKGICLNRIKNFKNKGKIMTLIKDNVDCDFFLPVDIDEFLVLYDESKNQVTCNNLVEYFNTIMNKYPEQILFKTEYIYPVKTNNSNKILKQFTNGYIKNSHKNSAKTFIQNRLNNNIIIDQGNHIYTNNYINTDLYLIHYTRRTHSQFKNKITNILNGYKYKINLSSLKELYKPGLQGRHHVRNCIKLLENPNIDYTPKLEKKTDSMIKLNNIINFIYSSN